MKFELGWKVKSWTTIVVSFIYKINGTSRLLAKISTSMVFNGKHGTKEIMKVWIDGRNIDQPKKKCEH
jgi:hypothetical protein